MSLWLLWISGEEKAEPEDEKSVGEKPKKVILVDEAALDKMYSYVQLNYGKTYLNPQEEKSLNYQSCRGIHEQCSLYYTKRYS